MKKIFLTTIALLSMASASVFGMYGVDSDWIFFLTHGNQFQARLETLGFTLVKELSDSLILTLSAICLMFLQMEMLHLFQICLWE